MPQNRSRRRTSSSLALAVPALLLLVLALFATFADAQRRVMPVKNRVKLPATTPAAKRAPSQVPTTRKVLKAPACPTLPVSTDGDCGPFARKACPKGQCCSQHGYCGVGPGWCGSGCQRLYGACNAAGACGGRPSAPTKVPKAPTPPKKTTKSKAPPPKATKAVCPTYPLSTDWACGPTAGTACPTGYCCSQHGYCGIGEDWCGATCQVDFGSCNAPRGKPSCFGQPIKATSVKKTAPKTTKAAAPPPPPPTPPSPPPPPPPTPPSPPPAPNADGAIWSTMPRSWCYEVLLVRGDDDGNAYCEANFFNTGCNWRPADHRSMTITNPSWYLIPKDWIGNSDWTSLVWYDLKGTCEPYCGRMGKTKEQFLHDQDGQGCYYGK